MKVFLATVGLPPERSSVPAFRRLAERSRTSFHQLVEDADDADVVLFTECHLLGADWRLRAIARSPVARSHGDKVYVYDERDRPWCRWPGLYVSAPAAGFDPTWQRACAYYDVEDPRGRAPGLVLVDRPDLLFSFVGSPTHACREPLFALRHPRAVVERIEGFRFYDDGSTGFDDRRRRFAEVLDRSTFVLCPRGGGASSIRLYETMAAGRVPVIIADAWVPPSGPDWDRFSVRWPEGDAAGLVAELERREGDAAAMGAFAAEAFREWFAGDVAFDRLMDQLAEVRPGRERFPSHGRLGSQFARVAVQERTLQLRAAGGRLRQARRRTDS